MEIKRYYSEEFQKELIELSDERVLWRCNVEDEILYEMAVSKEQSDFEYKFKTEVYLCGRSGRHVCVEDTEENQKRYEEMKEWVRQSIERIWNMFPVDRTKP